MRSLLMGGQSGAAVAIELLAVSAITAVAGIFSFRQAVRSGQRLPRGSVYRTLGGTACYICEMIGAVVLFLGSSMGLYLAAVAIVANFYFMISGSWLLLIGVTRDESPFSKT